MLPLLPFNVKTVLLVPVQTLVAPLMLPATAAVFTLTTTFAVVAGEQTPLLKTA